MLYDVHPCIHADDFVRKGACYSSLDLTNFCSSSLNNVERSQFKAIMAEVRFTQVVHCLQSLSGSTATRISGDEIGGGGSGNSMERNASHPHFW